MKKFLKTRKFIANAVILLSWLMFILIVTSITLTLIPDRHCDVQYVERDTNWRLEGSTARCEEVLHDANQVSQTHAYTTLNGVSYWVDMNDVTATGPSCLIGSACMAGITQKKQFRTISLVALDSTIDVHALKAYLGGAYVSDGNISLYGPHRLPKTIPPFNFNAIRKISDKSKNGFYATDGKTVLYNESIVLGAHAPTFSLMPSQNKLRRGMQAQSADYARDRVAVYSGADRIEGADPATFRLVQLNNFFNSAPHGIDSKHVWNLYGEPLLLMPDDANEYRQNLAEFEKSNR